MKVTKMVFVHDCAADNCGKKNIGNGFQLCKEHQNMYDKGEALKAFYGKIIKKQRNN